MRWERKVYCVTFVHRMVANVYVAENYRNEKLDTSDWTAAREESEEEEKSEDGDSDGDTSSSEGSESSSG